MSLKTSFAEEDEALADPIRARMEEIARAEMGRHRRGLGLLSAEQITAVETLLISTATAISRQVSERIQSCPADVRSKYESVWSSAFAG